MSGPGRSIAMVTSSRSLIDTKARQGRATLHPSILTRAKQGNRYGHASRAVPSPFQGAHPRGGLSR